MRQQSELQSLLIKRRATTLQWRHRELHTMMKCIAAPLLASSTWTTTKIVTCSTHTHTHTPIQNNILCTGSTQLNVPQVENYIPGRRPLFYVPHPKKTTKNEPKRIVSGLRVWITNYNEVPFLQIASVLHDELWITKKGCRQPPCGEQQGVEERAASCRWASWLACPSELHAALLRTAVLAIPTVDCRH